MKQKQGSLDGLCGLYSAMNAVGLLSNGKLKTSEIEKIFFGVLSDLHDEGKLYSSIGGMKAKRLSEILTFTSFHVKKMIGRELRFRRATSKYIESLDDFWRILKGHYDECGSGSCIIGISGKYDHWTCMKRISSDRIYLEDSDGLNYLKRSECTVWNPNSTRVHSLWSTQTFLLYFTD